MYYEYVVIRGKSYSVLPTRSCYEKTNPAGSHLPRTASTATVIVHYPIWTITGNGPMLGHSQRLYHSTFAPPTNLCLGSSKGPQKLRPLRPIRVSRVAPHRRWPRRHLARLSSVGKRRRGLTRPCGSDGCRRSTRKDCHVGTESWGHPSPLQ